MEQLAAEGPGKVYMRRQLACGLSALMLFGLMGTWTSGCKRKVPPPKRRAKRPPPPAPPSKIPEGAKVHPEEVVLQPGIFTIGSPDNEQGRLKVEGPQHRVKLRNVFVMWRHEITQAEFRKHMGYNPAQFKGCGTKCPVEKVTWHEAAAFSNALSKSRNLPMCYKCTGKGRHSICRAAPEARGDRYIRCPGYRLPTEAEWEYAARAGSEGSLYEPVGKKKNRLQTTLDRITWHGQNSFVNYKDGQLCPTKPITNDKDTKAPKNKAHCGTRLVGQKQPNKFGLYDMLGGVSEWVYDHFGAYSPLAITDPIGPKGGHRVIRGCSWFHMPRECRIARRFWSSPAVSNSTIGFRPVRTLGLLPKAK